ncbi:ribosome maturation factor RimM [Acetobacter thailandicus]|uniref:ribosome maturation factor RimM n=1 Tax=Acetobacter thailandicus TaxID=1502842 RepID=UPI001BAB4DB4|nr:ribosome maturation factor RimM [Acetobacter thailandicus]MBS1003728.1 16S rRNA processing protein RimM [Acetobacter thailandicus]
MRSDLILIGVIGKAHGVRGLVRVHSYADDPATLEEYEALQDEQGRSWSLRWRGADGVAELRDARGNLISDRTAAQALVNTRLYVSRDLLPETEEEEFYHSDLIGMEVWEGTASLGRILMVHDYGGGASLEIEGGLIIPFTRACVPDVDLAARTVRIVRPAEVSGEEGQGVSGRSAERQV